MATITAAVALLGGLMLASPADAQIGGERRFIRIGFGGGMSVPTSDASEAFKNGINGQAFVLLDPGLGFPLRFNLGYQKFDFDESSLGGGIEGESQMLSGVGGTNIGLLRLGPIRPYITAGVGAFSIRDEVTTGGSTTSESNIRFGIDGGAGLTLKLGRLAAFLEGRVQNVYTDEGMIDTKSIRTIPVTFGIMF